MNITNVCVKWSVAWAGLLTAAAAVREPLGAVHAQEKQSDKPRESDFKPLFNATDLTGWTSYVDPKAKNAPEKLWSVKDGVLVCEGSVGGYLATAQEYENYVLRLEWRWGEKMTRPERGSSVFVHVTGPDKMLPKGLDATLGANAAGEFWLVGGYELKVDKQRQDPKVERHYFAMAPRADGPIGKWNHIEISCEEGSVRVHINDCLVNEGTAANPRKGRIMLLSEGAEIMFRNIELKPLSKVASLRSETPTSITLRRAEKQEETIVRQNIEARGSTGLSLMPEEIEQKLTPQDVADLIALRAE